MKQRSSLNRRHFLRIVGTASLALRTSMARGLPSSPHLAYVGSGHDEIHVFQVDGLNWALKQIVACKVPASLTVHPNRRTLYAINQVADHQHLPTGSVETFTLAPDGTLTAFSKTSLSLSATLPRHLTLSPDGKSAVVAIHGGGAYNLLSLLEGGQCPQVAGILKETGCGPDALHQLSAHPSMALFDTTHGRVLTSDTGSDQISVLAVSETSLTVHQRFATDAGSGPAHLVLHPKGDILFVANQLNRSLCSYKYDPEHGRILHCIQRIAEDTGGPLALHPSGRALYTIGGREDDVLQVWHIDRSPGILNRFQSWHLHSGRSVAMTAERDTLHVVSETFDGVLRFTADPADGRLSGPILAAEVPEPLSIATLSM
ncbi:lactonase family protein [Tunturiibacter gelidoferens]|uniref:6-phosphogluconolactonase (Cycloisomerase 2 family) n=2 Tax=Tunturiibacter TaxID=3154218 RepID=A0A7Y9NMI7_9BACT|nr:beta-propeller fold lactonase family protein [Edaphobacter lichenicola]MBB5338820.1 6-phosphogluconolactonase (cycloisomerase 2 family) [Edaphobacter lichenicola]NYF51932.1 6-phosphogluconolactonase (cycloisomerase 2 family) [Edaphobacter lichenicola]